MIVVDTSALMTVLLREPGFESCMTALDADDDIRISAGTLAEVLIVAGRRGIGPRLSSLLSSLELSVATVTTRTAEQVADAYAVWGKGAHPAGLNMGDCYAYVVAAELACPLLYIGNDFVHTDVVSALA